MTLEVVVLEAELKRVGLKLPVDDSVLQGDAVGVTHPVVEPEEKAERDEAPLPLAVAQPVTEADETPLVLPDPELDAHCEGLADADGHEDEESDTDVLFELVAHPDAVAVNDSLPDVELEAVGSADGLPVVVIEPLEVGRDVVLMVGEVERVRKLEAVELCVSVVDAERLPVADDVGDVHLVALGERLIEFDAVVVWLDVAVANGERELLALKELVMVAEDEPVPLVEVEAQALELWERDGLLVDELVPETDSVTLEQAVDVELPVVLTETDGDGVLLELRAAVRLVQADDDTERLFALDADEDAEERAVEHGDDVADADSEKRELYVGDVVRLSVGVLVPHAVTLVVKDVKGVADAVAQLLEDMLIVGDAVAVSEFTPLRDGEPLVVVEAVCVEDEDTETDEHMDAVSEAVELPLPEVENERCALRVPEDDADAELHAVRVGVAVIQDDAERDMRAVVDPVALPDAHAVLVGRVDADPVPVVLDVAEAHVVNVDVAERLAV